jgi:CPA2 family monovalent cation:H+ antiporter-2
LIDLQWREKYGINVVYIKRGENLIHVPDRHQFILPFDHVGIVATDAQVAVFKPVFDHADIKDGSQKVVDIGEIVFDQLVVNEYTKLKGLSIRDSGLRERTNGLVIGIERNNERLLNPDSITIFEWGDVIWIVGERHKIESLKETGVSARVIN